VSRTSKFVDAPAHVSGGKSAQEWLTVAELAKRLDLRVSHVRALVRRRDLPVTRVGRLLRFHWPTVQRALLGQIEDRW
jgi:excisionase family DNA binding protein